MPERALRVCRGPDNPAPLMGIINSLSFQLRNMADDMAPGTIHRLVRKGADYEVTVTRVGAMGGKTYGMEFVTTRYGKSQLSIVLVASDSIKFSAAVTLAPGAYAFPTLKPGAEGAITVYGADPDSIYETVSRETCPYIVPGLTNYASVAKTPGVSSWEEWHKIATTYIGLPTRCRESLEIFRPYGRTWTMAPNEVYYWHASMSPITDVADHLVIQRYINQAVKNYWPHNMLVTLGEGEIVKPLFKLITAGNYKLPTNPLSYYGKRPYTATAGVYSSYGEHISGTRVDPAQSDAFIIPSQFFWPWIPYMEEIGHFHLLLRGGAYSYGEAISPFYSWDIHHYTMAGEEVITPKFTDVSVFSNGAYTTTYAFPITEPNNAGGGEEAGTVDPCVSPPLSMNDLPASYPPGNPCYLGSGIETIVNTTGPYSSTGTKYTPIGMIGNKGVCYVKTEWVTSGSGPVYSYTKTMATTGNLPVNWIYQIGDFPGLMAEYWPAGVYKNQNVEAARWAEGASNDITLTQTLMFGDDVIDTGSSTMSYSLSRLGSSAYAGSWEIVLSKVEPVGCYAENSVTYTTDEMYMGDVQTITASTACPCTKIYWTAVGGLLSAGTGKEVAFTATACEGAATVSAKCDCGREIGSVSIQMLGMNPRVIGYMTVNGAAYINHEANYGQCRCATSISVYNCYDYVLSTNMAYGPAVGCGALPYGFEKLGQDCSGLGCTMGSYTSYLTGVNAPKCGCNPSGYATMAAAEALAAEGCQ